MRGFLATAILATMTCSAAAAPAWTPDMQSIAKLERAVRVPSGPGQPAKPLAYYDRYYAGTIESGHRMIHGEYILLGKTQAKNSVHIVGLNDLPLIMDGGCGIVNVLYDADVGRIAAAYCNGYA